MNNRLHIGSRACAVENNNLWISGYFFNGLFKMNLDDLEMDFIGTFPNEKMKRPKLHLGAHVYGSEIIFTPYQSDNVHIYDMNKKTFSTVEILNEVGKSFLASIKIENKIYFVSDEGVVLYINIGEKKIYEDNSLSKEISAFIKKSRENWSYSDDKKGYTFFDKKNNILRVDLVEHNVYYYKIKHEYNNIEIAYYNDNSFLFSFEGNQKLLVWYYIKDECRIINSNNDYWGKDRYKFNTYNKIARYGDVLFFTNYHSSSPIYIDKCDEKIVLLNDKYEKTDVLGEDEIGPIYSDIHFISDKAIMVPCYGKKLLLYDIKSNEIKEVDFAINKKKINTYEKMLKSVFEDEVVCESKEFFGMDDLIEHILY